MTQPLEENRLYSSWSRTPGKPSSSSNFSTKISNISSSTDSGVGRTPNWNSESDKFVLYDSNLWSNSNALSSDIDNPKKPLWEDNTNKIGNNFTFGFSSQWPTNNETVPWGLSRNNSSDFIVNNDSSSKLDNCWNNSQSSDLSNDRFSTRSISIWAANQAASSSNSISTSANIIDNNPILNGQFQIVDPINKSSSKFISKSIQLQSESSDIKSEFPLFSAFNSSAVNDIGSLDDSDLNNPDSRGSNEKNSEHQTWAQAAGKGLQTSVKNDDGVKQEVDEQFLNLINRIDGWGSHTVDQSTPWVIDSEIGADCSEKLGNPSSGSQRNRSTVESNVWTNEPPNGVGVWESHYENIGERTSRWGATPAISASKSKVSNSWELSDNAINSQWTDRDDNSVWSTATNSATVTGASSTQKQQSWGMLGPISKPDQAATTPIGSGTNRNSTNASMVASQRNTNAPAATITGPPVVDMSDQVNRHSFYHNQNINMMSNSNRMGPNTKSKMMNVGFRKEESQNSMFNNSMDMNRSFMDMKNNSSQMGHSNMMNSRGDWNISHDNYRVNSAVPDGDNGGVMLGPGYLQQQQQQQQQQPLPPMQQQQQQQQPQSMMPTNSGQSMHKSHVIHMQQMSMANRLPPPSDNNHILLEKQIIAEINQLQTKQQDLVQRIHGLRSIAGSQAFIQEMTRTLSEVRQQLNTQQTTLKVIRSQNSLVNNSQMPNGMMNSNSNNAILSMVTRTNQPCASAGQSQAQSGLVSDLSVQMNELKLQKSRMELWSQGNLPSPSTISPYMGTVDKPPSGFYNPSIPNGGPMPPQPQFSNYNRNSQFNCVAAPNRAPNQIWQSRMMPTNPNSAATSASTNVAAFNAGCTDSHSILNGPIMGGGINDDMEPSNNIILSGGGGCGGNNSNQKMQIITSNCASDVQLPQAPQQQQQQQQLPSGNHNGNNSSTANSAITTALSLSQTLPSSIGGRVSSAFSSSRDISHISANISEFVPGQPWPGISYSQRDDPNVTLGAGPRSLLSITNDHLEKLANSSVNSISGPNDVGISNSCSGNGGGGCGPNNSSRLQMQSANSNSNNMNGMRNSAAAAAATMMTYVLIRDLPSHINVEMLKHVLNPNSFPGLVHMHPNLASRWVLLHFTSNEEALKAYKNLYNKVGVVELLADQEVNQVIRGHRNNGVIDHHPMF